ncbi:MAG: integration host factor subunit beta [Alphaproteobacteria bacterium]|nr:integration host factor subunit beta [Alphaproteobacteria bacterium]MBE8220161.1 integration host factor subunit beta [Alphaproteobacteria bacterium]
MIKSELITRLAEYYPHLYQSDVEKLVRRILEEVSGALEQGRRVELRNFGTFTVRHRKARMGRNPRTGDQVAVPAKYVPHFKAGKALRDRLNKKII